MKWIRPLAWALLMVAGSGVARAAEEGADAGTPPMPAPKPLADDWQIEVRVDSHFAATASLVKKGAASQPSLTPYSSCSAIQPSSGYRSRPYPVRAEGFLATSEYLSGTFDEDFLTGIVEMGIAECKRLTGEKADRVQVVVNVEKSDLHPDVVINPDRYELPLAGWSSAALKKLGVLQPQCKAFKPSVDTSKEIACTASLSASKIVFRLGEQMREGRIEASFGESQKTQKMSLDIDICHFEAAGGVRVLVQGAMQQEISLIPVQKDVRRSCESKLHAVTHLRMGEVTIPATQSMPVMGMYGGVYEPGLEILGIPDTLTVGAREFELVGPEGVVGLVSLEVVPKIVAEPKIKIDYRLRTNSDPKIAKLQSYFENASGVSTDGIAVVNPMPEAKLEPGGTHRFLVANTVSLTLPSQLPVSNMQTWKPILRNDLVRAPQEFVDITPIAEPEYVWVVELNPFGSELWFEHAERLYAKEPRAKGAPTAFMQRVWAVGTMAGPDVDLDETARKKEFEADRDIAGSNMGSGETSRGKEPTEIQTWPWRVLMDGAKTITFDILRQTDREIRPTLALLSVQRTRNIKYVNGDKTAESQGATIKTLLRIDVSLAQKARRESVPMPIRDLLAIGCVANNREYDNAANGATKAIENEAIRTGRCKIQIGSKSTNKREPKDSEIDLTPVLPLFGPQTLLVTVKRDGADPVERVWPIRLEDGDLIQNRDMVLPTPSGDERATGVYRVEAHIAARLNGEAVYRSATPDSLPTESTAREQTDLKFTANLRPRGLFGWRRPIRTYLTAFVPLSGFRAPAVPTELRDSGQSKNIQYVAPRLGLLFNLEPFDADQGINPWPLNPSIQAGMNILKLNDADFAPTFLLGGALSIPLLDTLSSQATSKVTLGMYYEYDPRVEFKYANHLLMTLGLNIGSLFSGNVKQ